MPEAGMAPVFHRTTVQITVLDELGQLTKKIAKCFARLACLYYRSVGF